MTHVWNPPPGWPPPPSPDWTPPPGWEPDSSWPHAPMGWDFWRDEPVDLPVTGPALVAAPSVKVRAHRPPVPPALGGCLSFIVLVGIIAAAFAIFGHHGSTPASTAAPLASPSLQSRVASWRDNGGLTQITDLQSDFAAITTASGAQNFPQLHVACQSLLDHVVSAQAYDPVPDQETQIHWAASLAQYAHGATDCLSAIDRVDGDLLTKSGVEISSAADELSKGAARLRAIVQGNL